MKTSATIHWLAGVAGGLLLSVPWHVQADVPWGAGGLRASYEECVQELEACEELPCATFPGDGQTGLELSYTDNGDGTFTDDNTGLMWEIKDGDDGVVDWTNPHDVDNQYSWSATGVEFDGTAKTWFLDVLNDELFAGYDDWRLPTGKELQSLVDYSVPYPGPCVAEGLPGATAAAIYWSSTFDALGDGLAWNVYFPRGNVTGHYVGSQYRVRAMRGGL